MTTDYRPNTKLALSTIAIKWSAAGRPVDYLLDASEADLVIDSLLRNGWSIIPTEIADAAHEVVQTHTEVTELEGVLCEQGPRFVQLGDWWVNPDAVHAVQARKADPADPDDAPGSYVTIANGSRLWPNIPPAEVLALLTAVPPVSPPQPSAGPGAPTDAPNAPAPSQGLSGVNTNEETT